MFISPHAHVYLLKQKETGSKSTILTCSQATIQTRKKNNFPFLILKTNFFFPGVHEK